MFRIMCICVYVLGCEHIKITTTSMHSYMLKLGINILKKYNFFASTFVHNSQPQKQLGSGFDISEGKTMTFFFELEL